MFYRENSQLSTPPSFSLSGKISVAAKYFFDVVFPKKCFSCKKEGAAFCALCRGKIPLETSPLPEDIISVWRYDNPVIQKAIWRLKYRGKQELAHDLAESMHDALLEYISEDTQFENTAENSNQKYVIIPIPVHASRRKERGYNQCELLGDELVRINPRLFVIEKNVLIKTKATKSQVSTMSREKRLKNIHGSFGVMNAKKLPEKIFWLWTTL